MDFDWKIAYELLVSKVMDCLDLLEETVSNGEISSKSFHKIIKKLIQDEQKRNLESSLKQVQYQSEAQPETWSSVQNESANTLNFLTVNREEASKNLNDQENVNAVSPSETEVENVTLENMDLDSAQSQIEQVDADTNNVQKLDLTTHSKIHCSEESFSCSYPDCHFSTNLKNNLISQFRVHTGKNPYKCPEADFQYSARSNSALYDHQKNHESKRRPLFPCPLCEYSGKSRALLSQHMKIHSLEKPFVCSFESCEYKTKFKQSLSTHLQSHSEEKQFKCELCPYRGKTRGYVKIHLKQVHSDHKSWTFKCKESQCDFVSRTNRILQRHLLTHNEEQKYTCSFPDCDFLARAKNSIKQHELNVHSEERKEKCRLCHFKCKAKSSLAIHMRTHTKEEPYKCNEPNCEYGAKSLGVLKAHDKRHHLQIAKKGNI